MNILLYYIRFNDTYITSIHYLIDNDNTVIIFQCHLVKNFVPLVRIKLCQYFYNSSYLLNQRRITPLDTDHEWIIKSPEKSIGDLVTNLLNKQSFQV